MVSYYRRRLLRLRRRRPMVLILVLLAVLALCLGGVIQISSIFPHGLFDSANRAYSSSSSSPFHPPLNRGPPGMAWRKGRPLPRPDDRDNPNRLRLMSELPLAYGVGARPPIAGLSDTPLVLELDPSLVPGCPPSAKPRKDGNPAAPRRRRLVVVGDVHGMLAPLEALLDGLGFDRTGKGGGVGLWGSGGGGGRTADHLVLAGDMVNKGPDSAGVVALAMRVGATAVRGNHEDRVLAAWDAAERAEKRRREREKKMREQKAAAAGGDKDEEGGWEDGVPGEMLDELEKVAIAESNSPRRQGVEPDLETARQIGPAGRDWLRSLPVIVKAGPLPGPHGMPLQPGDEQKKKKHTLGGGSTDEGAGGDGDEHNATTTNTPLPHHDHYLAVVHAGLVPGVPLQRQDPRAATTMRTLQYHRAESLRAETAFALRKLMLQKTRGRSSSVPDADVDDAYLDLRRDMLADGIEKLGRGIAGGGGGAGGSKEKGGRRPDDEDRRRHRQELLAELAPLSAADLELDDVPVPLEGRAGRPWAAQWDRWQARRARADGGGAWGRWGRSRHRGADSNSNGGRGRPAAASELDIRLEEEGAVPTTRAAGEEVEGEKMHGDEESAEAWHGPVTVVYGHDSRTGLRVGPWSVGLDTGCVRGGRLTALVIEEVDEEEGKGGVAGGGDAGVNGGARVTYRLESVDCAGSAPKTEGDDKDREEKEEKALEVERYVLPKSPKKGKGKGGKKT